MKQRCSGEETAIALLGGLLCALLLACQPVHAADDGSPTHEAVKDAIERGEFQEAVEHASALIELMERGHGPASPEVADALDSYVEAAGWAGIGTKLETLEIAKRAVSIRERYPDQELALAKSLIWLGWCIRAQNTRQEEALAIFRRSLEIRERLLGERHKDTAEALSEVGKQLTRLGKKEGIAYLERALLAFESSVGPDSWWVAEVLDWIAASLPLRDPARERHWLRCIEIMEGSTGSDRAGLPVYLTNFGFHYARTGQLTRALQLFERGRDDLVANFGPDRPQVADALRGIGGIHHKRGNLDEARRAFERSLEIHEKLGEVREWTAATVNGLGGLYLDMGDYARAESFYRRSLAIGEELPDIEQQAVSIVNLGLVAQQRGELSEALRMTREGMRLLEGFEIVQDSQIREAKTLCGLVLNEMGDCAEARRELAEAEALIDRDTEVGVLAAPTRSALGSLIVAEQPTEGLNYLEVSVRRLQESVGSRGKKTLEALTRLAVGQLVAGFPRQALASAMEAEDDARRAFRDSLRGFNEEDGLVYRNARPSTLDLALSLVVDRGEDLAGVATRDVLDQVVRSRALVFDEMATRRPGFLRADPEIAGLVEQVLEARERSAWLAVATFSDEEIGLRDAELERIEEIRRKAEQRLAEVSLEYRRHRGRFEIGLDDVAAALPGRAALVSYLRYEHSSVAAEDDPDARCNGLAPEEERYVAFVLPGPKADPLVVPLGDAARIDALVGRWRAEMDQRAGLPATRIGAERRYDQAGTALRHAIWDPVEKQLGKRDLVLIVPDGALNYVNLATLPVVRDRYLVEQNRRLHYLGAERDLIRDRSSRAPGAGLLAVGGPEFDQAPESAVDAVTVAGVLRGTRASCDALRKRSFSPLPAAGIEAREIAGRWEEAFADENGPATDVVLLTGPDATEAAIKHLARGHRVVHLATHGYFASGECASLFDPGDRPSHVENPLLLSGLALAGVNRREQIDYEPDGTNEDGMLTAQEIASLDLTGTEWVVLSACETGLGDVRNGEGVLGLRRAFQLAGAHTTIMSLWDVGDEWTREWMLALYDGRLKGLSTVDAVTHAQRSMIETYRKRDRSTHPANWGAFVAVGDWK